MSENFGVIVKGLSLLVYRVTVMFGIIALVVLNLK
jgi:hypothetical protein